jgi:hypothetical protein
MKTSSDIALMIGLERKQEKLYHWTDGRKDYNIFGQPVNDLERIKSHVEQVTGINPESKSREMEAARSKTIYFFISCTCSRYTLKSIARSVSMNYATVIYHRDLAKQFIEVGFERVFLNDLKNVMNNLHLQVTSNESQIKPQAKAKKKQNQS